ncbi:MAG: hypothetical protein R6U55_10985 [Desulfovermiculus sp.]
MRFEYHLFRTDFKKDLEVDLNQLGNEGWELISVCPKMIEPIHGGGGSMNTPGGIETPMPTYLEHFAVEALVTMKRPLQD